MTPTALTSFPGESPIQETQRLNYNCRCDSSVVLNLRVHVVAVPPSGKTRREKVKVRVLNPFFGFSASELSLCLRLSLHAFRVNMLHFWCVSRSRPCFFQRVVLPSSASVPPTSHFTILPSLLLSMCVFLV